MRINSLLILLICLLGSSYSKAQNKITSDWHLGISYFGNNLWNPGVQITGQKLLYDRKISKTLKNEKIRVTYQQIFLDANLGSFYDNPTYWSIFNNYQVHYRRVRKRGKYKSLGLGFGTMRNFLPETYSVDDQGTVSLVKNSGIWYSYPVLTLGTGRLWKRHGTQPWRLQLHTFLLLNYNTGVNPLFNVEYSYIFGYKSRENEN